MPRTSGSWAPADGSLIGAMIFAVAIREPAFATDPGAARYYHRRAPDYDDWYRGDGRYARPDRPGWHKEVTELIGSLVPARTIDLACGTGFLTDHLPGFVVGLDQSPAMVEVARSQSPRGMFVIGDALHSSIIDGAVERVFTGHFYGHLPPTERADFLSEARRISRELVVIDSARREGVAAEAWQERELADGSRHEIYKRYLTGDQLARELGGGEVLMEGRWFVAGPGELGRNRLTSALALECRIRARYRALPNVTSGLVRRDRRVQAPDHHQDRSLVYPRSPGMGCTLTPAAVRNWRIWDACSTTCSGRLPTISAYGMPWYRWASGSGRAAASSVRAPSVRWTLPRQ
jgi:SAM-dependent methyltransferase